MKTILITPLDPPLSREILAMSHVRRPSVLLLAAMLAASLGACGGDGDAKPPTAPTPSIATVTVTAATTTVLPGQSTQLVARAATPNGQAVSAAAFTWLSEAPAVATVDAAGRVTAVSPGTAVIVATAGTVRGTATITVRVVPVASVTLTPATGNVFVGSTLAITAQARDSANTVLVGRMITWTTDNAAVASVSSAGVVTGISTGTATITATSEGRTATARVAVSVNPTATANVRFFNATTGMTGSGGFTTNGQFATGSTVPFGQSAATCATVAAGATSFGFGAANTGGTGLSGSALATLSNQTIMTGGNYTVVATGVATSPTLFLLDNTFSGTLAANQAAVRFVNLARGTGTTANTFVVFAGAFGTNEGPIEINLAVGAPTAYRTVTGGASTFSVLQNPGHNLVIPSVTVTLQAGTVNTLAIVPNPATGGFQLINVPRC